MKRTILSLSAATMIASVALAQSDGRSFDAAVELAPGMTIERNGDIWGGNYNQGLLQHGDIVRTDPYAGQYMIVTSDGSVISMSPNSEIYIDGTMRGFDVFQVTFGSANKVGNAYDGYPVSGYFRGLLGVKVSNNMGVNSSMGIGGVTEPTVTPNNTVFDTTPTYNDYPVYGPVYNSGYPNLNTGYTTYGGIFPPMVQPLIPTATSYQYWNPSPSWSSSAWPGWTR